MNSYESIFHDVVENTRLGQDKELRSLLLQHENPESAIFQEVDRLIEQLSIKEFQEAETTEPPAPNPIPLPKPAELPISERRASIELILPLLKGPGLSKPPDTAVSNVNVNLKVTDLENKEYVPAQTKSQPLFKDKIRQYQAKLTHKKHQGQQKPVLVHQRKSTPAVSTVKAHRTSLAEELLPEYIREQLHLELRDGSAVVSEEEHSSHHSDNNRFHNIVSNSQSFHVSNTQESSHTPEFSSIHTDVAVSDSDKEYILPSLFTRSLDEHNNDMLLYESNDEEEEDEPAESEDEYLFK